MGAVFLGCGQSAGVGGTAGGGGTGTGGTDSERKRLHRRSAGDRRGISGVHAAGAAGGMDGLSADGRSGGHAVRFPAISEKTGPAGGIPGNFYHCGNPAGQGL